MGSFGIRALHLLVPAALATAALACSPAGGAGEKPRSIRLVDQFDPARVEGSSPRADAPGPVAEWRFDGEPAAGADPTRGFRAGHGVADLRVEGGRLAGRITAPLAVLAVERTAGLDDPDELHAVEIRMRVTAGANLSMATRPEPKVDFALEATRQRQMMWFLSSPLLAGERFETYRLRPAVPVSGSRVRHLLIRPSDEPGAEFEIESVRLVFEREHLAGVPSGVGWHGLRDVFRETLVTRAPEVVRFPLELPSRPLLDLAVGTPEEMPATFRVTVAGADGREVEVLAETVTTPHRWTRRTVDLAAFAGRKVTVALEADSERAGTLAYWGAPAVRQRAEDAAAARTGAPPRIVVAIQADTLRRDHLELYGYERETAPAIARLGGAGVVFEHAITQTGWTKAASPSIATGLYPSTHGVHKIPDRLPVAATTLAEVFREAGYATLAYSSVFFTGAFTNLHQGFEELHEAASTEGRAGPKGSKTAREYVDRLLEWIDDHPDVPVFVYLHVFDPHSPYQPNRPWDTWFADPAGREPYERRQQTLKGSVRDAFLAQRGMATRDELVAAGIDPGEYVDFSKDWYDGSIRGMDHELSRLFERLEQRGLADESLIAFFSDHGEEFHDHGRMWHGQSVYGEMIRVPLVLWGPGRVAAGRRVEEPAQLVDLMPTLLDLAGLPVPPAVQGRSLRPLLSEPAGEWRPRPVFAEKRSMGGDEHPGASESFAIVDGRWKLIHHPVRAEGRPEYELFDFLADPLDQRDLADAHPDEIERLGRLLDGWRRTCERARLASDAESTEGIPDSDLEQLRSLGYIR